MNRKDPVSVLKETAVCWRKNKCNVACSILASEVSAGCWGNWERLPRAEQGGQRGTRKADVLLELGVVQYDRSLRYILRCQERGSQRGRQGWVRDKLWMSYTMVLGFSSYVNVTNLCMRTFYWKSKSMKAADRAKQKLVKNVKRN